MMRELYPQLSGLLSTQPTLNLLDSVALCQLLIHTTPETGKPSLKKYCVLPRLDHCHSQPDVSRKREGTRWSPGEPKGNSVTSNWVGLPHIFCFYLSFYLYIILNTNRWSLSKLPYGYKVYLYKCYRYEEGFYWCWEWFKTTSLASHHGNTKWHSYAESWCRRNYLNPGVGGYHGQTK